MQRSISIAPPEHQRAVLQLDVQGTPQAWISLEQAATHYASGSVAWEDGERPLALLRGGMNARTGRQSRIEIAPIVALRGVSKINLFDCTPAVTKRGLLLRDRHCCAYCARVFPANQLEAEHIVPESRGGAYSWLNLVCACGGPNGCNTRKGARTPAEAGMPLVYLPYVPSRYEAFLLQGRNIRADVHEWLASRLPKGSRMH